MFGRLTTIFTTDFTATASCIAAALAAWQRLRAIRLQRSLAVSKVLP